VVQTLGPSPELTPPALVIIGGPTAVGKTEVSIELAERLGAEIISADSVQLFKGLDIGSAKPSPEQLARVPHHLVDVLEPWEKVDAARYARMAEEVIAELAARGKRAMVVGGSGLYIRALLFGLAQTPPVDPKLRQQLASQWQAKGPRAMHQWLERLDAATAARLHPNDRQRVLRALEVCIQTGRPFSELHKGFNKPRYPYIMIVLFLPKDELDERIAIRTREMFKAGIVEEVKALLDAGVAPSAHALGSLGYRQAVQYIQGRITLQEAIEATIKETKAYARRQLTWFRKEKQAQWFLATEREGVYKRIKQFWEEAR